MSLTVKKTIKECPHGIKLSVNSNHDLKWRHTYRGNSSNDLTEWSGEFGSFLCTSTSFLFWTSLFLRTLINREASATASAVSVEWKVNNSISIPVQWCPAIYFIAIGQRLMQQDASKTGKYSCQVKFFKLSYFSHQHVICISYHN